jgi:hypothetical protein
VFAKFGAAATLSVTVCALAGAWLIMKAADRATANFLIVLFNTDFPPFCQRSLVKGLPFARQPRARAWTHTSDIVSSRAIKRGCHG